MTVGRVASATLGGVGFANHDGVTIACQVLGRERPWLVLVHGLGTAAWGGAPRHVASARRRVVVDNRGIGQSDQPPRALQGRRHGR